MSTSEKILLVLIILFVSTTVYFGSYYSYSKNSLASVSALKLKFSKKKEELKIEIQERDEKIEEVKRENIKIQERLTYLLQDNSNFPDMQLLHKIAGRLAGINSLNPQTQFGKLYIGKPLLAEDQEVKSFFIKKGITTVKFDTHNIISRAVFDNSVKGNGALTKLSHQNEYIINFIGKINEWDGRFSFEDCRITGVWLKNNNKKGK